MDYVQQNHTYQCRKAWDPLDSLQLLRTSLVRQSPRHQWLECNVEQVKATKGERIM